MKVQIIPYKGKLFNETRKSYFLKAFGEEVRDMRIIPFGKCNYACPYCKRNGFSKQNCIIEGSVEVEEEELFKAVQDAVSKGQIVRLSGGDLCTYHNLSIKLLEYTKELGGIGSMAHNGSDPKLMNYLIEHNLLDSLSVDLKAGNSQALKVIAGLHTQAICNNMWSKTMQTLSVLDNANNVKLDFRTCVFNDATYEELLEIGRIVQSVKAPNVFWTLRIYSIVDSFSTKTKSAEDMRNLAKKLSTELYDLKMGIRVKWEHGAFFYYLNGEEL